jgi:hypothetical protein
VQEALLPTELPKRLKGVDVAARLAPARELGGDLYDFLSPEPNSFVVAVGDVSGKGVPAALYSAFVGELVRSRTFRRRYAPERFGPAGVLASMNTILNERQLESYYCTLCYAVFDLKRRRSCSRTPGCRIRFGCEKLIDRADTETAPETIELAGVPLGSFPGSTYDELSAGSAGRRSVRVLLGRRLRSKRSAAARIRIGEVDEGARGSERSSSQTDRGRDFCSGSGIPRRGPAERRHDGGSSENHRVTFAARGRRNHQTSRIDSASFAFSAAKFQYRFT